MERRGAGEGEAGNGEAGRARPRRLRRRGDGGLWPVALWPLLLLLGATAGLVVVGALSLFQALRGAQDTALVEARRRSRTTAQALRSALERPEILDVLPENSRFSVAASRLMVPPEIEWLEPRPQASFPEELPRPVRLFVEEARRLEYLDEDASGAASLWRKAREVAALAPVERLWLLAASAQAPVASDAARQALLEDARHTFEGLPENAAVPDTLVGALLLLLTPGRDRVPDALADAFTRLQPETGRALLRRLERTTSSPSFVARLGTQLESIARWRRTHTLARVALADLLARVEPVRLGPDGNVIFFFGSGDESGTGAVLASEELVRVLEGARRGGSGGLAAFEDVGRLLPAGEAEDTVSVVAGIELMPTAPPEAAVGSQWVLLVLLIGLAGFLVLGVVLVVRALRRERLAAFARRDFLTAVTHELKTPLATIRLLVDVLRDARTSPHKRDRYHQSLAGETARLSMLVENVLDLGRLERGERAYDRRTENARDIVVEALELYSPLAARDKIQLEQKLGVDRALVRVDRGALVQVLLNLLENARRYAASGQRIRVTDAVLDGVYTCWVTDDGPGVPPRDRETIFAKFRSGKNAVAGGNPGVGLGLFLARAILRDHGGDLECVDPQGETTGASFRIRLPLETMNTSLAAPAGGGNSSA